MAKVLVFIEQRAGGPKRFSLEALSEGRRLSAATGGELAAVMVAPADAVESLNGYGLSTVYHASHPGLSTYSPQGFSQAVVLAAEKFKPDIILASASAMGRDFLPRVATALGVVVAQDCTQTALDADGRLELVRPIFAGKAYATVSLAGTPQMATLRPNVFAVEIQSEKGVPELVNLDGELKPDDILCRVVDTVLVEGQTVELTEAEIIVSGGRGLKGPENFHLVESLAQALGAAVGASRAVVDAGWKEHRFQVGQTGKTVSPTLYVACGISGAIQHLAGMSSSKFIAAINKDPEAPIFKVADFGIVGDVFEVLPLLTEEIRKLKSKGV